MATRQGTKTVADTVHTESPGVVSATSEAAVIPMPTLSVTPGILGDTLEVTLSRSFKINMGNYEATDTFAAVKTTVVTGVDMLEVGHQLTEVLDRIQADDLAMAKANLPKGAVSQVQKITQLIN